MGVPKKSAVRVDNFHGAELPRITKMQPMDASGIGMKNLSAKPWLPPSLSSQSPRAQSAGIVMRLRISSVIS